MIAYSQSSTEQRLDAAMDGVAVDQENDAFASLRARATTVNNPAHSQTIGAAKIIVGSGVVRVELMGSEADASNRAAVVVVFETGQLRSMSAHQLLAKALETVSAMGRQVDSAELLNALNFGISKQSDIQRKKVIATVVATISLVAAVVFWVLLATAGRS